jgi:SAM-dependent methyltransferase
MEEVGLKHNDRIFMNELIAHYNKFNEDKRLTRRHGQVEYITTMQYIHKYIEALQGENAKDTTLRILDIGAGTGRYAVELAKEGHDVTAVEYVKYNLGRLKQNADVMKTECQEAGKEFLLQAYQGDARKLKRFAEDTFDLTLLFGPMYHLYSFEDKLQALMEAKRVTKPDGYILVAYLMNEYGVLTYGFKEGNAIACIEDGRLDENFHCRSTEKELYDYVRLEDMKELRDAAGLEHVQTISADGPADYMRRELNAMSEEMFAKFIEYHLSTCERPELLGAGAHTVDILRCKKSHLG